MTGVSELQRGRCLSVEYPAADGAAAASPGHRLQAQHASLQQAAREEQTLGSRSGSPWHGRSPRPAAELSEAQARAMGSPIKLKLPGIERTSSSCSSRGGSPARWKPSAPGSLSPLTGLMSSSPAAAPGSNSSSSTGTMLRHAISARGLGDPARMLVLQESEQGPAGAAGLVGSPALHHGPSSYLLASSSSPSPAGEPHKQQQGWGLGSAIGSSSNGASGGVVSSSSSSSGLGPRGPSGGGGFTPHLLNGFVRDSSSGGGGGGVESPSRPRRASSAPGNQLSLMALAVQHSAQQAVANGAAGSSGAAGCEGAGSSSNSPRPYSSAAVVYAAAGRPSTLNLAFLDEGGGPGPPGSTGPTPVGSCDTPGSDYGGVPSPHSLASSMQESPHYQASRLGWKPRPPPSSSGGSASSTPHSCSAPGSSTSTVVQPHPPPPSAKKAAKPYGAAGSVMLTPGAPGHQQHQQHQQQQHQQQQQLLPLESPPGRGWGQVDSPRLGAPPQLSAATAGGGSETPGGSSTASMRRRAYSHSSHGGSCSNNNNNNNSGGGPDGLIVGSLGSGMPLLTRSSSGAVYADSSNPNSPSGMLAPRLSSSSGGTSFLLSRQDSAPFLGMGQQQHGASMPSADPLTSQQQQQQHRFAGGSSMGRESSSGGVPPLPQQQLSSRDSYSSSGGGGGGGGSSTPRSSSMSGSGAGSSGSSSGSGSSGGGSAGGGSAASAAGGAGARPGSGKKTVQLLVEVVRSRDEGQLAGILDHCRSGTHHGLNDLHPTTDRTPLHEAVCLGSPSMVHLLLVAGSNPNVGHPKEGTPLLQAAAVGADDMVQLLLDAGADVRAVDVDGLTALHHALRSRHTETGRLLVSHGADLTARSHTGEAPLDMADQATHQALCGTFAGGPQLLSPTGSTLTLVGHQGSSRGSLDGRPSCEGRDTTTRQVRLSVPGLLSAQHGSSSRAIGSSQPGTPNSSAARAAAAMAAAAMAAAAAAQAGGQHSLDASTPRSGATAAAAALGSFGSSSGSGGILGCSGDGPVGVSSPVLQQPLGAAAGGIPIRSSSCNGLAAISGAAGSSSMGGALHVRRQSSSSSGSLLLGGGNSSSNPPSIMALISCGSAGCSAVNSPSGQQLPLHAQGSLLYSGHSGSSTPAAAAPGGGAAAAAAAVNSSSGFSTPPISPSSVADVGPAALRRPSPPVTSYPSSRGRSTGGGISSDGAGGGSGGGGSGGGSGGGGGSGSCGLPPAPPSALASLSSAVLDQHPEERCTTPPVLLELPEKVRGLRKARVRPAAAGGGGGGGGAGGVGVSSGKTPPAAPADTGRREADDSDQGPPSSTAAAGAGSASSTSGGGGSSSSQATPSAAGPGAMLMRQHSSTTEVVTPTAVAAAAAGASSSSMRSSKAPAAGEPDAVGVPTPSPAADVYAAAGGGGGGGAEEAAAVDTVHDMRMSCTLKDMSAGEPQQQQSAAARGAVVFQQPAAAPVFKFGLDPGSSSAQAGHAVAAAAATAAAAAAAAKYGQPQAAGGGSSNSSSGGSGNSNPLAQTFRLHLADSIPREMQQAVQQQQQAVVAAQQQQQQRPSHDPRIPPLLQASPPATPDSAAARKAAAAAAASGATFGSSGTSVTQALPDGFGDATPAACGTFGSSEQQQPEQQPPQPQHHPHPLGVEQVNSNVQWRRGELLGEGAYGKVYAGLNQVTGEIMAVKSLQLVGRAGSTESQQTLAELKQELELYQHLSHSHIVGYIGNVFDNAANALHIFLEYVPGGSIASMLQRFGRFDEPLTAKYTRQLLLGLDYLHGQQIVHRDLKGGNALVTRDGIVKLTDFGASKAFNNTAQTDMMKSMRGTAFWMAPEVLTGKGYGRKADIWSLGCTVVEMLTGKHPWSDLDNQWTAIHAIANTTTGPARPPGLTAAASDFLDHCFKVDPRERLCASQLLQHPWVADSSSSSSGGGVNGTNGTSGAGGGGGSSVNTTRARAALTSDEGPS